MYTHRRSLTPPSDMPGRSLTREERRLARRADRLMRRILQLDTLMCEDAVGDPERARDLRATIRRKQAELEQLYEEWDLLRE